MVSFEVCSLNPANDGLELMQFETLEAAEAHERRANKEGRLFVQIIQSAEEHEQWQQTIAAYRSGQ